MLLNDVGLQFIRQASTVVLNKSGKNARITAVDTTGSMEVELEEQVEDKGIPYNMFNLEGIPKGRYLGRVIRDTRRI